MARLSCGLCCPELFWCITVHALCTNWQPKWYLYVSRNSIQLQFFHLQIEVWNPWIDRFFLLSLFQRGELRLCGQAESFQCRNVKGTGRLCTHLLTSDAADCYQALCSFVWACPSWRTHVTALGTVGIQEWPPFWPGSSRSRGKPHFALPCCWIMF